MIEDFIESLYAKCPRCGSKLAHDEAGVPQCQKCYQEYKDGIISEDYYFGEYLLALIEVDTASPVLIGNWKELITRAFGNEYRAKPTVQLEGKS